MCFLCLICCCLYVYLYASFVSRLCILQFDFWALGNLSECLSTSPNDCFCWFIGCLVSYLSNRNQGLFLIFGCLNLRICWFCDCWMCVFCWFVFVLELVSCGSVDFCFLGFLDFVNFGSWLAGSIAVLRAAFQLLPAPPPWPAIVNARTLIFLSFSLFCLTFLLNALPVETPSECLSTSPNDCFWGLLFLLFSGFV